LLTHLFGVRLTDKQYEELNKLLNATLVLNCHSKSDRFRMLLDELSKERSARGAGGSNALRRPIEASSGDSCDFSKVVIGHREWLEQHFPGNRELQCEVAELLADYDPNSSFDWEATVKELKE
jgi:hypothetical protein